MTEQIKMIQLCSKCATKCTDEIIILSRNHYHNLLNKSKKDKEEVRKEGITDVIVETVNFMLGLLAVENLIDINVYRDKLIERLQKLKEAKK